MAPIAKAKKSAEPHKKTASAHKASAAKQHTKKTAKATSTKKPKAAKRSPATRSRQHPAPHHKRTLVAKHPKKKQSAPKEQSTYGMNEEQKIDLLHLIDLVILKRKHSADGLRSFFMIDRILDHYNQKYTHPESKFNAIVKYGAEKHDGVHNDHIYVFTHGKEKDETELYKLLSEINAEKIKFSEIKKRLESLVEENKKHKNEA